MQVVVVVVQQKAVTNNLEPVGQLLLTPFRNAGRLHRESRFLEGSFRCGIEIIFTWSCCGMVVQFCDITIQRCTGLQCVWCGKRVPKDSILCTKLTSSRFYSHMYGNTCNVIRYQISGLIRNLGCCTRTEPHQWPSEHKAYTIILQKLMTAWTILLLSLKHTSTIFFTRKVLA